jgi:formylglycine-generating enzyme required for sulfatase activity
VRTSSRRTFLRAIGGAAAFPVAGSSEGTPAASFRGARAGDERLVAGVRLCWCPPGRFTMGSPPHEAGRRPDEAQVDVVLTRGFWMARFEVTQRQWRADSGGFPERPPTAAFGLGDEFPVYWVSHADAEQFCARLTTRAHGERCLPSSWSFRLPTEAQWEYACRAGTTTATAFGDTLLREDANFDPDASAGRPGSRARGRAVRVGSYRPNPWGLCDMHGNVFEWCHDWYHARLPGGVDPDLSDRPGVRNADGTYSRCRRGGTWNDPAAFCRSALRLRYEPERRSDHIGFRVAAVEG